MIRAFAGEVLLQFKVRDSGRTAYENITGHRVKHPVVMFGETLNFKLKQHESRRRKVESDWSTGIFVGVDPRTSEALVISGRAFVPRRARLGQQDFEDFHYTRDAEDSNIFRRASDSARTTEIDVEI